jgi:hypothetical protein
MVSTNNLLLFPAPFSIWQQSSIPKTFLSSFKPGYHYKENKIMSIVLNQIIFSINYNRNFRVVVINISHQMKSNNGGTNIKKNHSAGIYDSLLPVYSTQRKGQRSSPTFDTSCRLCKFVIVMWHCWSIHSLAYKVCMLGWHAPRVFW